MAGQLSINPYTKSYDELQRSIKRMQTYLEINNNLLEENQKIHIKLMIDNMKNAIEFIPPEFRITKHHYSKKDKEQ